ncbi:glucose-1-phosphate thymidylyltransferase [Kutzneria viridogrisea]|uniref:Glucose-1-phosphate thymidylyltransferase n=1 Tax=Kutzneria viridogrisea TaxID=47990 RepID=A0ABR6BAF1_9PSEU|nr:glucose-1-phosphate thymidylyltransferase [Kutzneria viridogrisea]
MKALVLSGGLGTRLRPLTHSMPKQLVPVGNKPVLVRGLEKIREAGIREVGMIVGDTGPEIERVIGDGSRFGLRIHYIPQEAPMGLAHCVMIARDFLGQDDFLMYLGDNVLSDGLGGTLAEFHEHRPAVQLLVKQVTNPSDFGIAELTDTGEVYRLEEKPRRPRGDLAVMGVYLFTPAVHEAVRSIKPSARNEWEITDAIRLMMEQGQPVRARVYTGFWKDTGQLDELLECNRMVLRTECPSAVLGSVDAASTLIGPVLVEPGASVVRSHVVGPTIIGPDAVVCDSEVGPYTALGSGTCLRNSGIENSIVLEGASLSDVTGVEGSLIGREAQISRATPGRRFILGDHATVQVGA